MCGFFRCWYCPWQSVLFEGSHAGVTVNVSGHCARCCCCKYLQNFVLCETFYSCRTKHRFLTLNKIASGQKFAWVHFVHWMLGFTTIAVVDTLLLHFKIKILGLYIHSLLSLGITTLGVIAFQGTISTSILWKLYPQKWTPGFPKWTRTSTRWPRGWVIIVCQILISGD